MSRAEKIEKLLTNNHTNIDSAQMAELVGAVADMDDMLLVETFRAAWVCLAYRLSGENPTSPETSWEGRLHFMKQIHEMAAKPLGK